MDITHVNQDCVTDSEGQVGHYLTRMLRNSDAARPKTLFHLAGTEEDDNAAELNFEATLQLLMQLEKEEMPQSIVYLSSSQVYSPDAGEGVDESRPAFAWSEAGKTRARTELMLEKWCAQHDVRLAIVRPAHIFGKGMSGDMVRLFDRVVAGRYVHIRGNEARLSAVTALDVARTMLSLAGKEGIYNVSDGHQYTWVELAEAMSANTGETKRMPRLPEKWAKWIYRCFGGIPMVGQMLSPAVLEPVSRTLTLDNSKVVAATGISYYNTLEVIARTSKDYPYEDS